MDFFNTNTIPIWLQKKPFKIENPFLEKSLVFYDLEVYPNYFLGVFIGERNKPISYTIDNIDDMLSDLRNNNIILIGFNNSGYDDFIIKWIYMNRSRYTDNNKLLNDIFELGNSIINGQSSGKKPQWYWDLWNYKLPIYRSIDVFNIPKREVGLKERACKRHAISIQDLPIAPCSILTKDEKDLMPPYCINDVRETIEEWNLSIDHILNRISIENIYPNIDVISRHDAGVCEEVLTKVYCGKVGLTKKYIRSQIAKPGKKIEIADCIPPWLNKFNDPILQNILNEIESLSGRFSTKADKEVLRKNFKFYNLNLVMGGGGLHSEDEPLILKKDPNKIIMEIDVAGYYTGLIKALQLKPDHLDHTFNIIQEELAEKRKLIKSAQKDETDPLRKKALKSQDKGLKIITLSIFGKTGNQYSILFDELMQLQITLGGQLSMLKLIEMLTYSNIEIISVNTDGLIIHIDKSQLDFLRKTYKVWELATRQTLEETVFNLYVRRDVNNYFAIKENGDKKEAGVFNKNIKGKASIIAEAMKVYFEKNILPDEYIPKQTDIRKFIYYFKASRDWDLLHKTPNGNISKIQNISRWYISKGVELEHHIGIVEL
jgi:hypothetical protein